MQNMDLKGLDDSNDNDSTKMNETIIHVNTGSKDSIETSLIKILD